MMTANSEKHYLISIDGGGTNTGICVYDRTCGKLRSGVFGGGNYKTHGIDTVRERILRGLRDILPDAEDIPAVTLFLVMGLSGCDSPRDLEVYSNMMQAAGFAPEQMLICNDSEMIFRSVSDGPGICTVAGTGTIALAFAKDGSVYRSGGWGAPISDEGSGYWIGAEIVRSYLSWVDGIGEYNDFFPAFRKTLGCESDEDSAARLAALNPPQVAEWAMPVFEKASENELCRKIIGSAAEKTADLTASACRKAGFSAEDDLCIVESGSLFKNDLYENRFREALRAMLPEAGLQFLQPAGLPAEDGIRLAMKMADVMVSTQSEG